MRISLRLLLVVTLVLLVGCGSISEISTPTNIATSQPSQQATVSPTPVGSNEIANLVAHPPPDGTIVELDAYYIRKWNPLPDSQSLITDTSPLVIQCPWRDAALTDTLVYGYLHDLSETFSNPLLPTEAYLVAVDAAQIQPSRVRMTPNLPYHTRLRGRFGHPAFAQCEEAKRIFVVESVVQVYEQDVPESVFELQPPDDYLSWTQHHNTEYAFSIPHPPNWNTTSLNEPNILFGMAFTAPDPEAIPVELRIYDKENLVDPADPSAFPIADFPATQQGIGTFQQGNSFKNNFATQQLWGYALSRQNESERVNSVMLGQNGKSYEIRARYPLGAQARQKFLTTFIAMAQGFRFDQAQSPTATPPIEQRLGSGSLLTKKQIWRIARVTYPNDAVLADARLMSEADARRMPLCPFIKDGHFDGIWVLWVRGTFPSSTRALVDYWDATDGTHLCGLGLNTDESPFR